MIILPVKVSDIPISKRSSGFVLITILLLLSILSVTALVAVEQSQLSYKINHARVAQMKARQISEDGRLLGLKKLKVLLADKAPRVHQQYANSTLDRMEHAALKHFLSVKEADAEVDVFLQRLPSKVLKNGVSLSQNMSYSGLGNGLGSQGSYANHYELRAHGRALDRSSYVDVWTASDFIFIPK